MTGSQGMFMRRDYRPAETSWHEQGRCQDDDVDDALFYHPENERGSTRHARADAAKAICRECPVRQICREQSLANREPFGVWGGLSEDERGMLLDGKPIEGPMHDHPRASSKPRQPRVDTPEPAPLVLTPAAPGRRIRIRDERVTEHVQRLVKAGHTAKQIAATTGVTPQTVRTIAAGRAEVTEHTANLLLAVKPVAEVAA